MRWKRTTFIATTTVAGALVVSCGGATEDPAKTGSGERTVAMESTPSAPAERSEALEGDGERGELLSVRIPVDAIHEDGEVHGVGVEDGTVHIFYSTRSLSDPSENGRPELRQELYLAEVSLATGEVESRQIPGPSSEIPSQAWFLTGGEGLRIAFADRVETWSMDGEVRSSLSFDDLPGVGAVSTGMATTEDGSLWLARGQGTQWKSKQGFMPIEPMRLFRVDPEGVVTSTAEFSGPGGLVVEPKLLASPGGQPMLFQSTRNPAGFVPSLPRTPEAARVSNRESVVPISDTGEPGDSLVLAETLGPPDPNEDPEAFETWTQHSNELSLGSASVRAVGASNTAGPGVLWFRRNTTDKTQSGWRLIPVDQGAFGAEVSVDAALREAGIGEPEDVEALDQTGYVVAGKHGKDLRLAWIDSAGTLQETLQVPADASAPQRTRTALPHVLSAGYTNGELLLHLNPTGEPPRSSVPASGQATASTPASRRDLEREARARDVEMVERNAETEALAEVLEEARAAAENQECSCDCATFARMQELAKKQDADSQRELITLAACSPECSSEWIGCAQN